MKTIFSDQEIDRLFDGIVDILSPMQHAGVMLGHGAPIWVGRGHLELPDKSNLAVSICLSIKDGNGIILTLATQTPNQIIRDIIDNDIKDFTKPTVEGVLQVFQDQFNQVITAIEAEYEKEGK